MSEEKFILNNWIREPKIVGSLYEFYISGEIESPECYIDIFDIARHARHDDTLKFYINSFGGDLFTAIQFLRVLSETDALVVVSIEGACMSAATLLFLAADQVEITPHSSIMLHDYSSGTYGKGGDIHRQILHERKWSENLFREVYEDFLSPDEISSMLNGKEIWLDSDDVMERMQKRADIRKELALLEEATKPEKDEDGE
jgi:ATP-dependent protease ClpP protease subunit